MRRSVSLVLLVAAYLAAAAALAGAPTPPARGATPVVTFDLTVSLEWQPGATNTLAADLALAGCGAAPPQSYLDNLYDALYQASAYLYRATAGQMALGTVTVYTGGAQWDTADMRILASNDYRPTAFPGGIVAAPTAYPAGHGVSGPTFYPAAIHTGRLWNGAGARCGPWADPAGWRTLGHELGHHALFLWDGYMHQGEQTEQYCATPGADPLGKHIVDLVAGSPAISTTFSLMAYQYRADQLWLDPAGPPACLTTPQYQVHATSDWQTIRRFYPAVSVPAALAPGPEYRGSAAESLFKVVEAAPAPGDTTAALRYTPAPAPQPLAEAYLVRPQPGGDGLPQRIIGQGALLPGETLPYWGALPGDRAAVLAQDWGTGERSYAPRDYRAAPALDLALPNEAAPVASDWRPAVSITPIVLSGQLGSEVTGLAVRLEDCAGRTKRVQLAYCPAGGDCGALASVSISPDGSFNHTFTFPLDGKIEPPAFYGYIYARNPDGGMETIAWYQLAGGLGPAIANGHAPLADAAVSVDLPAALPPNSVLPQEPIRVLYGAAQRCRSGGFALPPGVAGIIGAPLDVQPVAGRQPWGARASDPPLHVRLAYSQDLLNRAGIDERLLVVLRLEEGQGVWRRVPGIAQNTALDWITAQAQPFDGDGAVYALGYLTPPVQVRLPIVLR